MHAVLARHELRHVGVRNRTGLDDRTLRKAAARGDLIQVWRGVYVRTAVWSALGADDRRRLTMAAAADRAVEPPVFSHGSAALLLGVPTTARPDRDVEVLATVANGTRREHGFLKRATREPDLEIVEVEGLRVTSVARTVVELAMVLPFRDALAAADWALAQGVPRDLLLDVLDSLASGAAWKRGARVLRFADPRAGSAAESKSRALIDEAGFPVPELQTRFDDGRGLIGFVDFFWSEAALIGEVDGEVKYRDPEMLRGRTAAQVVMEEKRRENRLRATARRPHVVRWGYEDLTLQRLGAILFAAGLRPLR